MGYFRSLDYPKALKLIFFTISGVDFGLGDGDDMCAFPTDVLHAVLCISLHHPPPEAFPKLTIRYIYIYLKFVATLCSHIEMTRYAGNSVYL